LRSPQLRTKLSVQTRGKFMKKLMIAALVGGQLAAAAQPAMAADLTEHRAHQMGAFGGLSVRVPLDGQAQRRVRAGLAVAPMMESQSDSGRRHVRIGEGLELGVVGREPVRLSLAGQDVQRLGAAQQDGEQADDAHHGPSTLGWIAIGVGATVLIVGGLWVGCFSGTICDFDED
jgi:hypothetical protein